VALLDQPFAFFAIVWDDGRALRWRAGCEAREDCFLFICSFRPAGLRNSLSGTIAYDLPEPMFIEELRRLNGTAAEVLEDPS